MSERVQIEIEAQDMTGGVLRGILSQFGELGKSGSALVDVFAANDKAATLFRAALTDTSISVDQVRAAENLASAATARFGEMILSAAVNYVKDAIDTTQKYAYEVRQLSAVSGQSAESTSRFLQVLDDYKLTAADAMAATKALTKEGHAPNIETLAKLSDEYLAITNVQERNEFVIKNLGRAGLQWNQVLLQGGDAIRAQAAAVSDSLILDEKMLARAEQLRLSQDNLNDTMEGFKIVVGENVIPATNAWTATITKLIDNTDGARDKITALGMPFSGIIELTKLYGDTYNEFEAAATNAAAAQDDFALSTDNVKQAEEDAKKAAEEAAKAEKALSDVRSNEIGLMAQLYDGNKNYAKSQATIHEQMDTTRQKLQDTLAQGWWPTSDKVVDLQKEMDGLRAKYRENELQNTASTMKILYNQILQKASIDGLTDAEFTMVQKAGVALGIFDQKTADAAIAINDLSSAVASGKIPVEKLGAAINSLPKTTTLDVIVNTINNSTGGGPNNGTNGNPYPPGSEEWRNWNYEHGYAEGGSFTGWGLVGDAPGGELTPYSELVYAPGGATVIPASKVGNSGGGSAITFSSPSQASTSGGGETVIQVNLNYGPGISMHSENEIMQFVYRGIRKAQADGLLPAKA